MPANPTQGTTFEIAEIYPLGGEDNPKSAVDLRQGIIQFQYFEDLMSPVITAVMQVTASGNGVYNSLPIQGGEQVKMHFTTPIEEQREESPGRLELEMYVNHVTDYIQEKQKELFTLHLVSKEGITNLNKRIIKKYKQKRIDEVITDFLDILECEYETDDIEKAQNKVNFIGNMRKPFTLIPGLCARAIPEGANSKSAGFFLWQTKSGIKFKSIESIIKDKEISEEYVFNRKNEGLENPEASFQKILSYSTQHNNNVMAAQRGGEYSTYRIYFNPYTFEFTNPSQSVFKPEGQESLGTEENEISDTADPKKIPNPEMAHRIVSGVYACGTLEEIADVNVAAASTTVNQDHVEDIGQSISRYASIFTEVMTMTVALNPYLEAGDIIKCTFPQVSAEDDIDHTQSGLYIIKEISHYMRGNKSYSALKVIRDTPGD
tara:strand:- start:97 stop:1395 length:1299 start_codon:yes stop_codon:yes gene_type:complete